MRMNKAGETVKRALAFSETPSEPPPGPANHVSLPSASCPYVSSLSRSLERPPPLAPSRTQPPEWALRSRASPPESESSLVPCVSLPLLPLEIFCP